MHLMTWDGWYQKGMTAARAGLSALNYSGPRMFYGAWIRGFRRALER